MPGISRNDAAQDQQQMSRRRTARRKRGINRPRGGRGGGKLGGGGLFTSLLGLLTGLIGRHHAKGKGGRHRIGRGHHVHVAKGKGHVHRPRITRNPKPGHPAQRGRAVSVARQTRAFTTGVFSVVTRKLRAMRLLG
jgi:hypothetical protein